MPRTYFEERERFGAREAERQMVFAALRWRREHMFPRSILASVFWLLGVTR
jgi:hypothetical protein